MIEKLSNSLTLDSIYLQRLHEKSKSLISILLLVLFCYATMSYVESLKFIMEKNAFVEGLKLLIFGILLKLIIFIKLE